MLAHVRQQWMGALALFLTLTGGVAYAANAITSADIVDGEVKSVDIGNTEVRSVDIGPAAFAAPDIAQPSAGAAFEIADNAVQGFEISDGTVRSADIGTDTVLGSDIAANSVRADELGPMYEVMGNQVFPDGGTGRNGDWGTARSTASCFSGDELISAYAVWHGAEPGEELAISSLNMDPATETASAVGANDSGAFHGFEVFAVCLG